MKRAISIWNWFAIYGVYLVLNHEVGISLRVDFGMVEQQTQCTISCVRHQRNTCFRLNAAIQCKLKLVCFWHIATSKLIFTSCSVGVLSIHTNFGYSKKLTLINSERQFHPVFEFPLPLAFLLRQLPNRHHKNHHATLLHCPDRLLPLWFQQS